MRYTTFASLAVAAGCAVSTLLAAPAAAKVLLSPEEALALVFPGCTIERQTVYLTAAEVAAARELAGTALASAGEPVTTIQAYMGHSDLKTTERYMHYAPAVDEAARIGRAFALADPRSTNPSTEVPAHRSPQVT